MNFLSRVDSRPSGSVPLPVILPESSISRRSDEPSSETSYNPENALGDLGTTVVAVTHDPDVAARLPRTVTIRDGRVGAEGRRGEDFAVVGRDGSLTLPPDVLERVPPGSLLKVTIVEDDSVRLDRTDRGTHDEDGSR